MPQQGVHFVERELAVGTHRAVAGHAGQDVVLGALQDGLRLVLGQLSQDAASQLDRAGRGMRQRQGQGAQHQGFAAEGGDIQPQLAQHFGVALGRGDFLRRSRKANRQQQRLAGHQPRLLRLTGGKVVFQLFINHAFVRGMHIDHDQALSVFGQDVNAMQLRKRAAQRQNRGAVNVVVTVSSASR